MHRHFPVCISRNSRAGSVNDRIAFRNTGHNVRAADADNRSGSSCKEHTHGFHRQLPLGRIPE